MAAITLQTATTEQVQQTVIDVFSENLYKTAEAKAQSLTFERPGSTMDDIKYGGFFEDNIWVRVKVTISRYGDKTHLVEADAFIIRHYDEGFFEEEQKLYKINNGPYKKLLKEVQARLTP